MMVDSDIELTDSQDPINLDELGDEAKQQIEINEEYKVWKKNAPFLYDMVVTTSLVWPTLTCQWFPDIEMPEGKDYSEQRILMGTNTSNYENEYVQIASVFLPKDLDSEVDASTEGGYGGAQPRINITHKINHTGEVNKARYMPQKPDIIGTFSSTGQVFVFDRTRHPSDPPEDGKCRPEIELVGHSKEGFGLSWSPLSEGHLLTASADKSICHWNISSWTKGQNKMDPLNVFTGHTAYVEDVAWHPLHEGIFGSVGDDCRMIIWDCRKGPNQSVNSIKAHTGNANCISFSPFSDTVLATAGADKVVNLWDLRNLNTKLHTLVGHTNEIRSLSWSPTESTILASSGLDRRVNLWDISRIGEEQTPEDKEDGPPELMFLHGGHTDVVSDISWNLNRPWTLASASEDNVCQIWQVAQNLYTLDHPTAGEDSMES